ncbi:hypothetical protein BGX38DRAFT_826302 [Terfezia claveryi]|nr:hypothetical protein BGX38DRAFT_826302 [Terfezia claveryi]
MRKLVYWFSALPTGNAYVAPQSLRSSTNLSTSYLLIPGAFSGHVLYIIFSLSRIIILFTVIHYDGPRIKFLCIFYCWDSPPSSRKWPSSDHINLTKENNTVIGNIGTYNRNSGVEYLALF